MRSPRYSTRETINLTSYIKGLLYLFLIDFILNAHNFNMVPKEDIARDLVLDYKSHIIHKKDYLTHY